MYVADLNADRSRVDVRPIHQLVTRQYRYTTCANESVAGVTSSTDTLVTSRHVVTCRQRTAVTVVRCAFVNVYTTTVLRIGDFLHRCENVLYIHFLLGPFYGAIAVPSVTRCRCCRRRRCRGHRCAGGVRL